MYGFILGRGGRVDGSDFGRVTTFLDEIITPFGEGERGSSAMGEATTRLARMASGNKMVEKRMMKMMKGKTVVVV